MVIFDQAATGYRYCSDADQRMEARLLGLKPGYSNKELEIVLVRYNLLQPHPASWVRKGKA